MPWQIMVQLKGGETVIYSPRFETREAAEKDLAELRSKVGGVGAPDVTWMAADGNDILGAHLLETNV